MYIIMYIMEERKRGGGPNPLDDKGRGEEADKVKRG